MSYPSFHEYNAAVQNPQIAFLDPDLQNAKAQEGPLGLPWARCGGFAATYRMDGKGGERWAVRCFVREAADREARYEAISKQLENLSSPYFVPFEYQSNGVLVSGKHYPIVKMSWVEGSTLGIYLDQIYDNPTALRDLGETFVQAIAELEANGLAHGDIQHGNIMVGEKLFKFVDYDDMYVPGIRAKGSNTPGHPNYNSPLRSVSDFGPEIDRFSEIVILLAIEAIARERSLWRRYSLGGENILFARQDYLEPNKSELFLELSRLPALARPIDQLKALCRTPLGDIPSAVDFVRGKSTVSRERLVSLQGRQVALRQFEAIRAVDKSKLLKREGQVVEVVGKVTDVGYFYTSPSNRPYAFVNFDDWRRGTFRLVFWMPAVKRMKQAGIDVRTLKGRWLSVTGLVNVYNHQTLGRTPQISVEYPHEVRFLSGEQEAERLLRGELVSVEQDTFWNETHPGVTLPTRSKNEAILDSIRPKQTIAPTSVRPRKSHTPQHRPTKPTALASANQHVLETIRTQNAGRARSKPPQRATNPTPAIPSSKTKVQQMPTTVPQSSAPQLPSTRSSGKLTIVIMAFVSMLVITAVCLLAILIAQ